MSRVLEAGREREVQSDAIGNSPPIVRLSALTKEFPVRRGWSDLLRHPFARPARTRVIDGVSLEVRKGEFFGLLGANGAGKTTLFRMLAAHLIPDSGTATICGQDVVRDRDRVRRLLVAVGTDERTLNWRLTAAENMELFASLYRVPRDESKGRIRDLLETVDLHQTGNKPVGSFSSGMKQRLLIGRALLARPEVLLLDEPTRSLDPVSARNLRRYLRESIVKVMGCTVLLATHNAEEAFELCDRVAILERGRLIAAGRARELMGEVSEDRYRLEVRASQARNAIRLLGATAEEAPSGVDHVEAGWTVISARIPGGVDGAADALGMLTRSGVEVAHFRRIELSLADLIEGVVARRAGGAHA